MPAVPEKTISSRAEWLVAAFVTVAIVWLHFHFWKNAGALWRDEINTVNLAQGSSLAALTHDTFPVLMPLLVKIWSGFGRADQWLRLLGMICGLALPAVFWLVARVTKRPPLFSLVLFGLNSLLITYGDSLRAYGLGSAFIVLALAAMWSFLKNPTWSRAAVLAFAATLSVQALFQNAVLFFAVCLGGFAVCWRRKDFSAAQKILCAGLVAAASLLPYLKTFIGLPQAAVELRRGFSLFVTSLNFEMATGFPFVPFSTVWKMLAVLVIGFALFSMWRKNQDENIEDASLSVFAGVTLVGVIAMFLGFLWFAAAGARPWYFLPPLALAAVCFDFGLPLAKLPRLARATAFGLLAGTAIIAMPLAAQDLRGHFTNADKLAVHITAKAAPQDFVVVTPWFCGITFAHYFHGSMTWETLPPLTDHSLHRYDLVLKEMADTNSLAPVLDKMSATLRSGHRIWVVGLINFADSISAGEPSVLPPPPLPGYGWSDTPYMGSWSARTAYFLARHSEHFEIVPVPDDGAPNFQENLRLFRAEGWRD